MATLALDADGNLALPCRVVRGIEACRVAVYLRMVLLRGTYPSDADRGVPWETWTGADGGKGPSALAARALIRAELEDVECVERVLALAVTRTGGALRVVGSVQVRQDGETGTLDLTTVGDPFATSGASPWYVVTRGILHPPATSAGVR